MRKADRSGSETKEAIEAKWATKASESEVVKAASTEEGEASDGEHEEEASQDSVSEAVPEEPKKPYRIPKRPRPDEKELLPGTKRSYTPSALSIPTGPRQLGPAASRSHPPSTEYLSRSWNAPAPSSAYVPPQQGQDSVYGRRDFAERQPAPERGRGRQNGRPNHQGGGHYRGGQIDPRYGNGYYGNGYGR